jgi:hypothetical protein
MDPPARLSGRTGRKRKGDSLYVLMAVLTVDEAIPKTAYGFEYRWLSWSRFAELAPQVLNVLADPHRAGRLVNTDHRGDLRGGDDARGFCEQVLHEGELTGCQLDCRAGDPHLVRLHVEFDRPVVKNRG